MNAVLLKIDVDEIACYWKLRKRFQEVFSAELVSGLLQAGSLQDLF